MEWEVDVEVDVEDIVEVVVDMVATEVVKVDMEVDHMEVANKVDMEVAREVMVVVDEEADMVVAADTVVEMVELEDMEVAREVMEVAREVMAEEEHKDTIKAFKHFSSPHSSLFSKTIFGNVMYVLYLYLYSNPYSDVELLLHQPKSATLHSFSLKKCFINLFQKTFLRQTLFDDKLFCIRQSNQKKMLSSVQKEKV